MVSPANAGQLQSAGVISAMRPRPCLGQPAHVPPDAQPDPEDISDVLEGPERDAEKGGEHLMQQSEQSAHAQPTRQYDPRGSPSPISVPATGRRCWCSSGRCLRWRPLPGRVSRGFARAPTAPTGLGPCPSRRHLACAVPSRQSQPPIQDFVVWSSGSQPRCHFGERRPAKRRDVRQTDAVARVARAGDRGNQDSNVTVRVPASQVPG